MDVQQHWDLTGLWAFASQYGAYSPGAGAPLELPGHGDQGVFNALTTLLRKAEFLHALPEAEWCDSSNLGLVAIRESRPDGRLRVENAHSGNPQRIVHCSGAKWWTKEGAHEQGQRGDRLTIFRHFYDLVRNAS